MKTIQELAAALDERALALRIFDAAPTSWVVWVYANDDPGLGVFVGVHDDLEVAIGLAIAAWDGTHKSEAAS